MAIDTAIVLAAGMGSRLREVAPYKPLCPIAGRPLVSHAIHRLAEAGIARAILVLGYGSNMIAAYLDANVWPIEVSRVETADWRAPNGVSVLAAASRTAEALLAMCDHIVEPDLYRRMALAGPGSGLRLGIDRRLDHPWVDPEDVTRVETQGDAIVAIGKGLERYDCHDTGVFAIGPALFEALATLTAPSLTQGVQLLAARGLAGTIDCSDLDWIDVDDAKALAQAEQWLAN